MIPKNVANKKKRRVVLARARLRGKGDYVTDVIGLPTTEVGKFARGLGGRIGGRIGRLLGNQSRGEMIGAGIGQIGAKLMGHGDYLLGGRSSISQNSILKGQAVASFQNSGRGIRITHREFISNVSATTDFTVTRYAINPALPETFPYLSQIAKNFEQYSMEGLVFQYVPTSGMVTASSPALGAVVMATDYDSYAPSFSSKQQMESYEFAVSCVPYESTAHGVECALKERKNTVFYTRTGTAPGSLLDYDLGAFQIATVGAPSTYMCGELWVSYDVWLLKPRIPKAVGIRFVGNSEGLGLQGYSIAEAGGAWGKLYSGKDPNSYDMWNTTGFSTPWFNIDRPASDYAGEPFGFRLGDAGLWILRRGQYLLNITHSPAAPTHILTSGTVTSVPDSAVTVNSSAGTSVLTSGGNLVFNSLGGPITQLSTAGVMQRRISQNSGSALTGNTVYNDTNVVNVISVKCLSDWDKTPGAKALHLLTRGDGYFRLYDAEGAVDNYGAIYYQYQFYILDGADI